MKYALILICVLTCVTALCGADSKPAKKPYQYTNGKWTMKEGMIAVLTPDGKTANEEKHWKRVGPAQFEIIWTENTDYGWNFTTDEFRQKNALPGPPVAEFLKKRFGAKTVLWTGVSDTPFRLATIDGKFVPILWDKDKQVAWQLNGLESALELSDIVIVDQKKAVFVQPGGDWNAYLTIDLSDAAKGIQLQYREQFDGF